MLDPWTDFPIEILKWAPTSRPFLLSIRAGKAPEYLRWLDFARERQWDLMLHYYATPDAGFDARADQIASGGASKFLSFHQIERLRPGFFSQYRAVALFDDDLQIRMADVDRLFSVFEQEEMLLAQPALTHDSHFSFVQTLLCPSFKVRYTNFVEVMMPVFAREALARCLPTFTDSVSSWGLDYVWPHLLGRPRQRVGVIDEVPVRHAKPVDLQGGAFYEHLKRMGIDPFEEKARLLRTHGLQDRLEMYGAAVGPRGRKGVRVRVVPD